MPDGIAQEAHTPVPGTRLIAMGSAALTEGFSLIGFETWPEANEEDLDAELASQLVASEINGLISAIQASQSHWIIVSNEVGMGLVPPYPLGRVYRDQLGWANKNVAGVAEEVIFMIAGLPWTLKPLND